MLKTGKELQKWIDEISAQNFEDATNLPKFEYETKNFDNIPQILTKFLFFLHTQVQSISQH